MLLACRDTILFETHAVLFDGFILNVYAIMQRPENRYPTSFAQVWVYLHKSADAEVVPELSGVFQAASKSVETSQLKLLKVSG